MESKRTKKLNDLLERLKRGEHVQNRDLQTWIGADVYADYELECAVQKELREELKTKPSAVRDYEQRLKLAMLAYNKGESASTRGRHVPAKRHFAEAETLFERALEYLQEIIGADANLCVWFDRDLNFAADSEISLAPGAVPLVVTSRSLDNRGGGLTRRLQSKRDLKIAAVERALLVADAVDEQDAGELTEKQKAQLDDFLKLQGNEKY